MNAGPRNGHSRGSPRVRPSREALAARATAASPGRALSTAPFPFEGPPAAPGTGTTTSGARSVTSSSGLYIAGLPPDPHALGEPRPEWVRGARDLDHQRPAERLPRLQQQAVARLDLALGQVAEHRGVAVRDAGEDAALPGLQVAERHRVLDRDLQIAVRDRIAVRIPRRLPELGRDQLLELLRDVVLQHLGLLVDPVPGHAKHLGQEELDQPVVADRL